MGFFKDFKRDFAQAVNELMPDKDETAEEFDDEDMVNTFDENDNMDIAPEDMLENLDDFSIEEADNEAVGDMADETAEGGYDEDDDEDKDALDDIPSAEIINDPADALDDEDDLFSDAQPEPVTELLVAEPEEPDTAETETDNADGADESDELRALDSLDESDMLEGADDVEAVEAEAEKKDDGLLAMDLDRDVMDAMAMRDDTPIDDDVKEDNMAGTEIAIEDDRHDIDSILNDDTTYITKGTVIKGSIETDGGIDIIGSVEGDVICAGKLIVGGSIKGGVKAGEVYANAAKIEGDVAASGSAKIGVGSVVVGNVTAASAVVAGAVNGDIDVNGPVIVDSTAVIMGNIKSRSVQINNGAVIEGFCSQCYSEIDVKSFFE